ncbi:hypothetical protein D3C85_1437120 [compost metagenome]
MPALDLDPRVLQLLSEIEQAVILEEQVKLVGAHFVDQDSDLVLGQGLRRPQVRQRNTQAVVDEELAAQALGEACLLQFGQPG